VETWQLRNGNDVGDLVAWEWRRHWRLSCWGLETKVETLQLGIGGDTRLSCWVLETTLTT